MRYRREDDDGDYTFGQGDDTWLINSPEAVAQAIKTRFELWYGQWFLDTTDWHTVDSVSTRQTTP
jgi:hypothetical protein